MWDVPDHLFIPVTVDGQGPADEADTAYFACWCGDDDCDYSEEASP